MTGEVFTVEYGEVRVLAGVAVVIVPRTAQVERAWQENIAAFSAKYREANTERQRLRAEAEAPGAQRAKAAWLAAQQAKRPKQPGLADREDIERWLLATATPFPPDAAVSEQEQRMVAIREKHATVAEQFLRERAAATALTNSLGRFDAKGLGIGPHYVWSRYAPDYGDEICWMVPIEVRSGAQTVNLSNANAGCSF